MKQFLKKGFLLGSLLCAGSAYATTDTAAQLEGKWELTSMSCESGADLLLPEEMGINKMVLSFDKTSGVNFEVIIWERKMGWDCTFVQKKKSDYSASGDMLTIYLDGNRKVTTPDCGFAQIVVDEEIAKKTGVPEEKTYQFQVDNGRSELSMYVENDERISCGGNDRVVSTYKRL